MCLYLCWPWLAMNIIIMYCHTKLCKSFYGSVSCERCLLWNLVLNVAFKWHVHVKAGQTEKVCTKQSSEFQWCAALWRKGSPAGSKVQHNQLVFSYLTATFRSCSWRSFCFRQLPFSPSNTGLAGHCAQSHRQSKAVSLPPHLASHLSQEYD